MPALQSYDAIVAPLLPGHGKSIAEFASITASAWVSQAEDSFRDLQTNYEKVDVLGLSLGGLLAYHLAQTFTLHRLFLLSPAFYLRMPIKTSIRLAKLLKSFGCFAMLNRGGNINDTQCAELLYRKVPLTTIIQILNYVRTYRLQPPTCPTELFLGKHDPVVHTPQVIKAFQPHKNTHIHLLNKASHVITLDKGRETICKVIQSLLMCNTKSRHNQN